MKKKRQYFILLFGLCFSVSASAITILVGHPITAGIAELLLKDTGVEIVAATPARIPAARQLHYLQSRGKATLAKQSVKADAAIIVKSLYAKDYLYPLARRHNINLIPIDIGNPIDGGRSGVAKLALPADSEHQVWLNPYSLLAMMSIFSDEVKRLKQTDAQMAVLIDNNLIIQQTKLRKVIEQSEHMLDEVENEPVALVLSPGLGYFVQGLQMESYQVSSKKITDEKLNQLVEENGINLIVLSKQLPESQRALLAEKGVKTLLIKRLKSTDPVGQLARIYVKLAEILPR